MKSEFTTDVRSAALTLLLAALALLGACDPRDSASPATSSQGEAATRRPNVILVVLDTTRRDRLSTYGYDRPTTPGLDRIAAEGVVFESCISAGSWTVPSHASLFTGLFPRDHGATVEHLRLSDRFATLAEILAESGYQTVGFSNNAWIGESTGFQQGFAEFYEIWRRPKKWPRDAGGAVTTEEVLAWTDARSGSGQPFFIFINYLEPHLPYKPSLEYTWRFMPRGTDPALVKEVASWKTPREFGYMLGVPGMEVTKEQFEVMSHLYDAEVAYQDSRFNELVSGLESRGLLDDTVLAVVADHGEQLGEHHMMDHKMSLYSQNVRVPLVIRYPPAIPQGVRIKSRVQSNDLFPTILRLAGIEHEVPKGSAYLPLSDDPELGREYAFVDFGRPTVFLEIMQSNWPDSDVQSFDRSIRAIEGDQYKYIWASDGERQLYDVSADPDELVNLADTKPEVVERLHALLEAFHEGREEMIWRTEMDPERLKALRSLGYLP